MADPRRPSLTVLSGPLAGRAFVVEDAIANVIVGSDETCTFALPLESVSPIHARVWVDLSGITVYDTNSPRGVYVNDDRVRNHATLRNGDILWLGYPGDADSVMLQVHAPADTAKTGLDAVEESASTQAFKASDVLAGMEAFAPKPPPAVPEEPAPAHEPDATVAMTREEQGADEAFLEERDEDETVIEPRDADETVLQPRALVPPPVAQDTDFIDETDMGDETVLEVAQTVDLAPPAVIRPEPPAPKPLLEFEEDIGETVADMPAVAVAPPSPVMPAPTPTPAPTPPRDEEVASATVVVASEPTVAVPAPVPPPPAIPVPPKPAAAPRPPRTETRAKAPTPAPSPARTPPKRPVRAEAGAPAAPAMARPAAPATGGEGAAPPHRKSSSSLPLVAGAGAVLLAVAAGAWWMTRGAETPATPPPTLAPGTAPAATQPVAGPAPSLEAGAEAPPASILVPIEEEVTIVRATPTPGASPSARVAPATQVAANIPPVSVPGAPAATAPAAPAAQVPSMLQAAQAASTAGNYDAAIGLYDQVLKADAGNAAADAGKKAATAARDALKKAFVASRTVVQTDSARGGPAGFEAADVKLQKAPDFQGRIEFVIEPPRVKPGDNYKLQIYLVNEGKKEIRIQSLLVNRIIDGNRGGGSVTPRSKSVEPQQRALLEEIPGVWPEAASWRTEVLLDAGKGNRLRSNLNWR